MLRAAQIAVENKMKFYKVASVQYGVSCKKGHEFYKGGAIQPSARPTVLIDVVYLGTMSVIGVAVTSRRLGHLLLK